jgi:aldose sugar dehydrogenase
MKKAFVLTGFFLGCFSLAFTQSEPFTFSELNQRPPAGSRYRLAHPFEIISGPDDFLYITERIGRIVRVNTTTGIRQVILNHTSSTFLNITRNGSGVATGIGQDGMMGMALHPNFGKGLGQDFIYVAYTYSAGMARISRFTFTLTPSPALASELVLIQGIPANNDHSSGRLIIGADNLLYYSCGDLGYNQFGNRCNEVRSQKLPTNAQITASNYSLYSGKTLRIELNGSIPASNPLFAGVRSHIFTIGHRNAQGLVTQKDPTDGTTYPVPTSGGALYNSEHGPRTDDEINIIQSGRNYGWPYISGYLDNLNYRYIIWATSSSCASTAYNENAVPAGALIRQETDSALTNFQPPISTLYTVCTPLPLSVCDAGGTNWMRYPTIAPASIDFYAVRTGSAIPNWYPSLLVPTLRRGVLYRYKLNTTMDGFDTDSIPYFRTTNRYRDMAISTDGRRIYLITDSIGSTSGPSGTGTSTLANPGAIMEYTYAGTALSLRSDPGTIRRAASPDTKIFPNPTSDFLQVTLDKSDFIKPVTYRLLDISGRELKRARVSETRFQIDVRNLQPGVYILKVRNADDIEFINEKIVVR